MSERNGIKEDFSDVCQRNAALFGISRTQALNSLEYHSLNIFYRTKMCQKNRPFDTLQKINGAQTRNRTKDTRIFSPLLYQLSYLGTRSRA